MKLWEENKDASDGYNCTFKLTSTELGLTALRKLFPSGVADDLNFVLFSTSGVHGSYRTIEEEEEQPGSGVTFLVIHPRVVLTRYGVVYPKSKEDFDFLKSLRAT